MSSRILLLSCLCLIVASAAVAEDGEPDYSRKGFYAALSLATGTSTGLVDYLEPVLPYGEEARSDAAFGVTGSVGMRMFSFLALEAQVEYLDGIDIKITDDRKVLDGDLIVAAVNSKGYFLAPWRDTGRFDPFVSVGLGLMQNWAERLGSATTFAARTGGGFDGYFTEHLAFTVEVQYVIPTGENTEWDYVSLTAGLMYKF